MTLGWCFSNLLVALDGEKSSVQHAKMLLPLQFVHTFKLHIFSFESAEGMHILYAYN